MDYVRPVVIIWNASIYGIAQLIVIVVEGGFSVELACVIRRSTLV